MHTNKISWKNKYPLTTRVSIIETLHGREIGDPYRWLEDPNSEETLAWGEKQNKLTKEFLDSYPKQQLLEDLKKVWNFPKLTSPVKKGGFYVYTKHIGLRPQPIIYNIKNIDEINDKEDIKNVILDPNEFSDDGTVAVINYEVSDNGRYLAYTYSNSGSDEQILKIKDIKTGQLVTEELTDIRFTSIIWNKHSSGFYYEKFPKHDAGINGIYYHNIGSHPSEDQLMYQNTLVPRANFILNISTNKEYLIIHEYKDTGSENNVFIVNLDNISEIMPIYTGYKASYTYLGNNECYYYFLTSINASNNQIIQFNLHDYPHFDEKVLIHEREYVIYAGKLINKHYLACTCIIDASYELLIYDLLDKTEYFVSLPTIGTLGEIQGDFNEPEIFFNFESYLHPTSVFMHRPDQKETLVIYAPKVQNFDVTNYETIKIKYQSKDNTQIPMFISKKKDIQLNGTNATLLYGYGGFKISLTPFFMPVYVLWLLKGGIFCVANIRGGGEYGQKWYDQGRRKNKQNVFDDFISGAEWLINNKYTTSHRLAIMGGSNGGLLVGACLVQRPDLFLGGVICNAGVLDMLRFHKFTIGYYWMSDYGNPELEEDFKYLLTYSPLHNIKKGITYPPTLVLVADTDDRVVPAHGKKFIATLQENDSGQYPILIHIETKAGHGRGKPTMKIIEQYADILTFINKIMSIPT